MRRSSTSQWQQRRRPKLRAQRSQAAWWELSPHATMKSQMQGRKKRRECLCAGNLTSQARNWALSQFCTCSRSFPAWLPSTSDASSPNTAPRLSCHRVSGDDVRYPREGAAGAHLRQRLRTLLVPKARMLQCTSHSVGTGCFSCSTLRGVALELMLWCLLTVRAVPLLWAKARTQQRCAPEPLQDGCNRPLREPCRDFDVDRGGDGSSASCASGPAEH